MICGCLRRVSKPVYFYGRKFYGQKIVSSSSRLGICPMCTVAKKNEKTVDDNDPSFVQKLKKMIIDEVPPSPAIETQSLIKGLLIDRINNAMLVYPEYAETFEVNEINSFGIKLERFFVANVNSKEIDQMQKIPENVIAELKKLGVYGLQVPTEFGGLGYNNKAMLRVHEELSRDWSIYATLMCHNDLIIKSIQLFGTEEQKQKYLPLLASGSMTGAFCLHEEDSGQDIASMHTNARYVDGQSTKLILNGKKTWITNGAEADILIVFAKLKHEATDSTTPTTAFILERKLCSNIKSSDRKKTIGLKGINVSDLEFKNVEIDSSSMLGYEGRGFDVALATMRANRYAFAAAATAFLRRLLAVVTQHCNVTKRWGFVLNDSNLIKARVGEISLNVFKLETMAYYIGGLLDSDPLKDFAIEGAIAMREARRAVRESLLTAMDIFGASARTTDLDFERLLRDFTTLTAFMSTNDYLSGYISMEGLQSYAKEWKTILHQGNNPLRYPWESMKERFLHGDLYRDSFKNKHYIHEKVHPSLETGCRFVEETMSKFEPIFRKIIYRYGKSVEEEHLVLERFADMLTILFTMISTISRASRSYSIGLNNADQEVFMSVHLCRSLRMKCLHILNELLMMQIHDIEDLSIKKIGDTMLKANGYTLEHPTARNW